jgi:hypothetical protein
MDESLAAPTGYLHRAYVASVVPGCWTRELPRSGAWIIERAVGGDVPARDAMGSYPLLCCPRWGALAADLDELGAAGGGAGNDDALVSLVAVTDPFGEHTPADLRAAFVDHVAPFKDHLVADLSRPLAGFVSAHHRRYARAAARGLDVERCADPTLRLHDWCALYDVLVARHGITGVAAFSRASFAAQLQVPGVEVFRAAVAGETVGMLIWYRQEEVAYYHLAAYSERGYAARASFALFWASFEHFAAQGVRWLSLGAGAGLGAAPTAAAAGSGSGSDEDGLVRFKRGWATGTRPTYLCGRILRPRLYAELVRARGVRPTSFFPAYRSAGPVSPLAGGASCELAI